MGFWGTLGRIGLGAASIVPGVGPLASMLGTAGKIASAAAPAVGALASGRAAGRTQQAGINRDRDQLELLRSRMQQEQAQSQNDFNQRNYQNALQGGQLDLQQRGFQLSAPQARANNSVRGDYLANARNTTINFPAGFGGPKGIPTIQRGFGADNFSQNTRDLGALMSQQALEGQQAGDKFSSLPAMPSYMSGPAIPQLSEMPEANALDKLLTTAGTVGSLYGSFDDFLKRYKTPGIRGPVGSEIYDEGGVG